MSNICGTCHVMCPAPAWLASKVGMQNMHNNMCKEFADRAVPKRTRQWLMKLAKTNSQWGRVKSHSSGSLQKVRIRYLEMRQWRGCRGSFLDDWWKWFLFSAHWICQHETPTKIISNTNVKHFNNVQEGIARAKNKHLIGFKLISQLFSYWFLILIPVSR